MKLEFKNRRSTTVTCYATYWLISDFLHHYITCALTLLQRWRTLCYVVNIFVFRNIGFNAYIVCVLFFSKRYIESFSNLSLMLILCHTNLEVTCQSHRVVRVHCVRCRTFSGTPYSSSQSSFLIFAVLQLRCCHKLALTRWHRTLSRVFCIDFCCFSLSNFLPLMVIAYYFCLCARW